jgi:hypothetical protein
VTVENNLRLVINMILRIVSVDGDDFTTAINPNATVDDLRYEASRVTGKLYHTLIFRARVLNEESRTLAEYGVRDGATIHVVNRYVC